MTAAPDLLDAILASTRARVEAAEACLPRAVLEREALAAPARGAERFERALAGTGRPNVIAECKRRSPSRGVLRVAYDPAAVARAYEAAGAAAVSVLTEPAFFDGHLDHLRAVRAAVALPVLRKDFIVDEYQLLEARVAGADAVLLIAAALDAPALGRLVEAARALGLAALVEVHGAGELDAALAAGARVVGVNNRNLRTLDVDLRVAEEAARRIPAGVTAVCESGLRTSADLRRMAALGYRAFLVGEHLIAAPDPGKALAALLSAAATSEGSR